LIATEVIMHPKATPSLAELAMEHGCVSRLVHPGQVLLRAGEVAGHLYSLDSGCLRAAILQEGRDLTVHLFLEGQVFCSIESFFERTPSEYSIEAVEVSQVLEIPRNILERMAKENPGIFAEIAIHHRYWIGRMTRRIIELLICNPEKRYLHYSDENPELMGRLPQYMVASLLGITPESLSRIRRRLSKRPGNLSKS
jgi:CRP-like cAMP-binding protein